MIHYSCDVCRCDLDSQRDEHYVVTMEIRRDVTPLNEDFDEGDRDHLQEIHEILEGAIPASEESIDEVTAMRFDLCYACAKKFAKNPIGRESLSHLDFSAN